LLLTGHRPAQAREGSYPSARAGPSPDSRSIASAGAFLAELERRIAEVEEQCARERMQSGRRVVGRRCILRQSWRDSPTSREPRRNLRPRIAARNKADRIAAIQRNKQWQAEYRSARQQW